MARHTKPTVPKAGQYRPATKKRLKNNRYLIKERRLFLWKL